MIIRAATAQDAEAISAIWTPQILKTVVTFNSIPFAADAVAQMIADRPCFLVVERAGQIAGFATYFQFRGGIGYVHTMEHTIILAPEVTGQGAGRVLMQALMDHACAANVHMLMAGVCAENVAGIAFHRALGFDHVAVLPEVGRKFGRWMDLVLMQKRL